MAHPAGRQPGRTVRGFHADRLLRDETDYHVCAIHATQSVLVVRRLTPAQAGCFIWCGNAFMPSLVHPRFCGVERRCKPLAS